jgi:predicted nucleic acid-binding protein
MKRFYLDANIIISFIRQEIGFMSRGLFIEVNNLFEYMKENNITGVISDLCLEEIETIIKVKKEDVQFSLKNQSIITEFVSTEEKLDEERFSLLGVHYADALHLAIAIHFHCDALVTLNTKDFNMAKKWVNIIDPREF